MILVPQIIQGKNNVLADSLSRPNQVKGSEWTLKWEVFRELNNKWPMISDHFATSLNHRCSLYFLPFRDRSAISRDALLQNWDGYHVYTLVDDTAGSEEVPIIFWGPYDSSCSILAPETMVSGPLGTSGGRSDLSTPV